MTTLHRQATFHPSSTAPAAAYTPALALILYAGPHQHLAMKHAIHYVNGQATLGPATPLSDGDTRTLVTALAGTDLLPVQDTTLAVSATACAWWVPPGTRAMTFDAKYQGTETVARFTGTPVPHPGLVFIASARGLKVFAVPGPGKPRLDTLLYCAPFWNMFGSHTVCQGTVQYPARPTPELQDVWTDIFFRSTFTGPSRQDRYMNWDASYEELLQHATDQGAFPEDVLVSAKLTLQEALR